MLADSGLGGRILGFGWAPPADDEEHIVENENGEEETEVLPGLRLWVTTLLAGCTPHTRLIDLQGTILGAFELPISGSAVHWLADGRRVVVTDSLDWFPCLWDGAALSPLPLPACFSQLVAQREQWAAMDGRQMPAISYCFKSTPAAAPLILLLHDVHDHTPMLASRAAVITYSRAVLPLLHLGYRIIHLECASLQGGNGAAATSAAAAAAASRTLISDIICGLDQHLSKTHSPEEVAATQVGVMGLGGGGLLALNAVAWSGRFAAAICQGAPISDLWNAFEMGALTRRLGAILKAGAMSDGGQADASARVASDSGGPLDAPAGSFSTAAATSGLAAAADVDLVGALGRCHVPVLLLYGDADPTCPLSHAQVIFSALSRSSPLTQLVVYPDETHGLQGGGARIDSSRRACEWFTTHLPHPSRS